MASTPGASSIEPIALKPMRRPGVMMQKPPDVILSRPESHVTSMMAMFKLRTLNATLCFVKNDTQLVLRYDDMSSEQAEFVTELITQCTSPQSTELDVGFGYKSLNAPLAEAMNIFGLKYDFKLIKEALGKPDTKRLRLEKIPKYSKNQDLNVSSSSASVSSQPSKKKLKKARRKCRVINSVINVDDEFKRLTIRRIKEFLHDDARESLQFNHITEEKTSFIKEIKKGCKRIEYINMFEVSVRMDLEEIRHFVSRQTRKYKIKITHEKVGENHGHLVMRKSLVASQAEKLKKKKIKNKTNEDNENSDDSTSSELLNEAIGTRTNKVSNKGTKMPSQKEITPNKITKKPSQKDINPNKDTRMPSQKDVTPNKDTNMPSQKDVYKEFKLQSLRKLKDFLSDSAQASLLIPRTTSIQMSFLQLVLEFPNEKLYPDLETREVLKEVQKLIDQSKMIFKVMVKKTNVDPKLDRGDLTFMKIPTFAKPQPQMNLTNTVDTNKGPNTSAMNNGPNSANKPKFSKSFVKIQGLISPVEKAKGVQRSVSLIRSANDKDVINGRDRSVDSMRGPNTQTSMTSLPPHIRAGSSVAPLPVERVRGRASQAKAKLIEGLNQPLVSEKGLKMMKLMGWQGGALGTRGDGIKEPIPLSLDSARRIGLGHPSAQTTYQPPPTIHYSLPPGVERVNIEASFNNKDHHAVVLKIILELLTTEKNAFEMMYMYNKITVKGWKYIKNKVLSLNTKKYKQFLSANDLNNNNMNLMENIIQAMQTTEDIVTACWGTGQQNVLFVKLPGLYQPQDKEHWCEVVNVNTQTNTKAPGLHPPDNKMVDGDTFRYYTLVQILEFCEKSHLTVGKQVASTVEKLIPLRGVMSAKQTSYIEDLLRRLNVKSRCSSDSKNECAIFDEILRIMKGYKLEVEFPLCKYSGAFKTILLRKVRLSKNKDLIAPSEKEKPDEFVSLQKSDESNMFNVNCFAKAVDNKMSRKENKENDDHKVTINNKENVRYVAETNCKANLSEIVNINAKTLLDGLNIANGNNAGKTAEKSPVRDSFDGKLNESNKNKVFDEKIDKNDINQANNNSQDKDCQSCLSGNVGHNIGKTEIIDDDVMIIENDVEIIIISDDDEKVDSAEEYIELHDSLTVDQNPNDSQSVIDNWENILDENVDVSTKKCVEFDKDILSKSNDVNDENIDKTETVEESKNLGIDVFKIYQIISYSSEESNSPKMNKILPNSDDENEDMNDRMINIDDKLTDTVATQMVTMKIEENDDDFVSTLLLLNDDDENKLLESDDETVDKTVKEQEDSTGHDVLDELKYKNTSQYLETIRETEKRQNEVNERYFNENTNQDMETIREMEKREDRGSQELQRGDNSAAKRLSLSPIAKASIQKKSKYPEYLKQIMIVPKGYPQTIIDNKAAAKIQTSILNSIDYTQELPLLQCQGLKNGALHYSCHSEKSYSTIESILDDNLKIVKQETEVNNRYKIAFRMNSFIDEKIDYILTRLELYNQGIDTKDWVFLKREECNDLTVIYVEIDEVSFNYIRAAKFCMYAGIDEAKFSIVWT